MQRNTLGFLALTLLWAGCFAPDDMDVQSGSVAQDETTGTVPEPPGASTSSEPVPEMDETTGGPDDDGSSTDGESPPDAGTTTGIDEGTSSSSGEVPGDESTGEETCELGTPTDCLACGDACSAEGTCTTDGCLEPITLGHADAFDGLGGLDGFLWGFPVELDAPATLTHLAFIAGGPGGDIQLSLYADAAGAPGARLVTAPPVFDYGVGAFEQAVPAQPLAAGTYWIMATVTNPTRIAIDINGGMVNFGVQGIERDFADGHPDVIANPIAFVNFRPNFYLRLEQLQ